MSPSKKDLQKIRKQIVKVLIFNLFFFVCLYGCTKKKLKVFRRRFVFVLKLPNNKVLCTFFRKLRTLVRKSILCSFPFCSFVLSLTKMKCNPTQKFVVFFYCNSIGLIYLVCIAALDTTSKKNFLHVLSAKLA